MANNKQTFSSWWGEHPTEKPLQLGLMLFDPLDEMNNVNITVDDAGGFGAFTLDEDAIKSLIIFLQAQLTKLDSEAGAYTLQQLLLKSALKRL